MDVDSVVDNATPRNRSGCQICALEGDPKKVVERLETIILERGRRAVSASALAENAEWRAATGIGEYPLRDHFRKCLSGNQV